MGMESRESTSWIGAGMAGACLRVRRVLWVLAVVGVLLTLALVPAAGARSRGPMRSIPTEVRVHHGHLPTSRRGHLLVRGGLGAVRAVAHSRRARVAIVGGEHISIARAPWQVVVIAFLSETQALLCGGSILNSAEVLTAGHCVYNPNTRALIPAYHILVVAGTSNFKVAQAGEQESFVAGVRVHPYYVYDPEATRAAPDDVAVLKLEKAFVLGSTAEPIALASAGSLSQQGAVGNLTGFGEENPFTKELNGELYSIGMTLGLGQECSGEASALFLCASTPNGSLCLGDSGSGLTAPGSPVTLTGVADTVEVISGVPCRNGALGGFADVAAPEIQDFVDGSESPPRAPRGGGTAIYGVTEVGSTLTCEPGSWSDSPAFTYAFIDSASGQVLQQGPSSTYALSEADIGRTILCQLQAANAGGTAVARTEALPPIERAKAPPPESYLGKDIEELKAIAEANKREAMEKKAREEAERQPPFIPTMYGHPEETVPPSQSAPAGSPTPLAEIAAEKIVVSGGSARGAQVVCAGARCQGSVELTMQVVVKRRKGGRTVSHKETLVLAKGLYSIAAGDSSAVVLHLTATGRQRLAHVKRHPLRAKLTLSVMGGTPASQSVLIR